MFRRSNHKVVPLIAALVQTNSPLGIPDQILLRWEVKENGMNLISARPADKYGKAWNFKRVVDEYGYPMFTKRIANAIRTYRRAKSDKTRQHSIEYIEMQFKKYTQYKECNISDKCCDKLKKTPIKQLARKHDMECVILGTLAEESRQQEVDWLNYGCNVFYKKRIINVVLYPFGLKKIYMII